MQVVNPENIEQAKKFYCKSNNLKKFLLIEKGFRYISKMTDEKTNKLIWVFIKTKELDKALEEWSNNKKTGNFYVPRKEVEPKT